MPRFRVLFTLLVAALTSLAASAFALPAVSAAVTPTTLYAVDGVNQTVVRFVGGAPGAFTKTVIGRNLNAISGLAADPAGNVYLLNDGRLVRIGADGVQRSVAANLTGLNSLVVDPRGTVFVADAHRVIRIYQPSGKQSVMGSISQTIGNLGVDGSGRPTVTYPNAVVPERCRRHDAGHVPDHCRQPADDSQHQHHLGKRRWSAGRGPERGHLHRGVERGRLGAVDDRADQRPQHHRDDRQHPILRLRVDRRSSCADAPDADP